MDLGLCDGMRGGRARELDCGGGWLGGVELESIMMVRSLLRGTQHFVWLLQ